MPCSSTATKSRGVRWVGCICRTELRRARQTTGIHHSGTNTKPREVTRSRQEACQKTTSRERSQLFAIFLYGDGEWGHALDRLRLSNGTAAGWANEGNAPKRDLQAGLTTTPREVTRSRQAASKKKPASRLQEREDAAPLSTTALAHLSARAETNP